MQRLRSLSVDELTARTAKALTVVLSGTGSPRIAEALTATDPAVERDPLAVARDNCMTCQPAA